MKTKSVSCVLVLLCCIVCGCSKTIGRKVTNSNFVYPNSNVNDLGPTSASKTKMAFMSFPKFSVDDIKSVHNDALGEVSRANVLLNYSEDATVTSIPFFTWLTYSVDGEAAKMSVGRQYLK